MNYIENPKELNVFFDENYYKSINYLNYLQRQIKYKNTAIDIIEDLKLNTEDSILDYGCATGLLLEPLKDLNFLNTLGFDISEWAIQEAKNKLLNVTNDINEIIKRSFDLTIVLDVFEHMFDNQIHDLLDNLKTKSLLCRIPVSLDNENDFFLEVSKKDRSHVNCKSKKEWIKKIEEYNFTYSRDINNRSIYDSDGCFCGLFIKK
jgi:predicted TPR repeat methyltransferase